MTLGRLRIKRKKLKISKRHKKMACSTGQEANQTLTLLERATDNPNTKATATLSYLTSRRGSSLGEGIRISESSTPDVFEASRHKSRSEDEDENSNTPMYTYEEYRRIAEEKDEEIKNGNKKMKEKIENAIKELNNVKEENEAIKKEVAEMLKETDSLKKPFLN